MGNAGKVKLTNNSALSNTAALTINGQIIPFYEATVHFKVRELVTLTVTTRADLVDIEALERTTELIIRHEDIA